MTLILPIERKIWDCQSECIRCMAFYVRLKCKRIFYYGIESVPETCSRSAHVSSSWHYTGKKALPSQWKSIAFWLVVRERWKWLLKWIWNIVIFRAIVNIDRPHNHELCTFPNANRCNRFVHKVTQSLDIHEHGARRCDNAVALRLNLVNMGLKWFSRIKTE